MLFLILIVHGKVIKLGDRVGAIMGFIIFGTRIFAMMK